MDKDVKDKDNKVNQFSLYQAILKVIKFSYNVDKRRSIIILIVTFLSAVIAALSAWYFSKFLNIAVYASSGKFFTTNVIITISIMLGLYVCNTIVSNWGFRVSNIFSRSFFTENYIKSAEASERIDIQTYESPDFTLLKNRVNMYFGRFQTYGDNIQSLLDGLIPMIISTIIIITLKRWVLLFFVMLPAVLNFWLNVVDGRTLWECENMAGEERKKFSSFSNFFNWKSYVEQIKIYGLKDSFIGGIKNSREIINEIFNKRDKKYYKWSLVVGLITNVLELVVPVVLFYQIFTGSLLIGTFYFINGRLTSFTNNFRQVLRSLSRLYKDAPYVSDILKYFEMQPVLQNGTKTLDRFEKLEVKDLSFTYPESDRVILHDFDFTIKRGEKVAVIGLNGAGKTTMTKLLLRFYFPTTGTVEYNGIDIRELDKYNLYQHIGFLPQDFAKFDLTFAESIALGNVGVGINNEKVIEAAKKANIHEFIMSHKDGYQTQIGKKYKDGVELSGGQWQKMAIASMFYRNAELWILDEPTSAIDAEAEANIFESLSALPDDITVIMISHRFSTVRNADRIMVIDHGGVKESGTHEELLQIKDGEYARLFAIQAEGYK